MATPSVLTVPSMYGDGILYSGPTVFSNELIINGDFATDSDWTKGTGWTISGGKAIASGATGSNNLTQGGAVTPGKKYKITITVSEYISGTVEVSAGASPRGEVTSVGTFNFYQIATPANSFYIISQSFQGSVDSVSVKEITQGSDFEFTRATTGTRINEEGYIENVPYNLLRYSENQLGGGVWGTTGATTVTGSNIANPKGTTENVYLISGLTGSGGNDIRQFPANFNSANQTLTFSVWLKGSGNIRQQMSNGVDQGIGQEITLTSNWVRHILTATFNSTNSGTQFHVNLDDAVSGTSATEFYMWGAQLVKGDQPKDYLPTTDRLNLPRLNYPTYGGCPSLLVEPQRTNLIIYSQDYTQWTSSLSPTVTSNFAISPEGITNANKITASSNNSSKYIGITLATSTVHTSSVFLKNIDSTQSRLEVYAGSWAYPNFEISWNGYIPSTLSSNNVSNIQYQEYTNNWWRVSYQFTTDSSITSYNTYIYPDRVNASKSILAFGSQLEVGSYATSLIHTSGAAVTRNEDKALYAGLGTTDTFNDSEGVLFIETEALVNEVNARGISINANNSGSDRVLISYPSSSASAILGYVQSTAGSGASIRAIGVDTTQKHKIALKYKLNDTSLFIDGVKRGQDTSVAMPVGLQQLDFSNGIGAGTAEYEGNLNAIAVYKTALTDTELANLTSYNNHDFFIPYRSRMQMISADQELQCTEHDITRFL